MHSISQLEKILITLTVADNQVLFILLAKDGTINRLGDGNPDCKEKDLFIGLTKDIYFYQLIKSIDDFILDSCGTSYSMRDQKGRICKLQLLFDIDGKETGLEVIYGEHSQGPPPPIRDYVISAVELTDNWYEAQKKMTKKTNTVNKSSDKKWWEFWK